MLQIDPTIIIGGKPCKLSQFSLSKWNLRIGDVVTFEGYSWTNGMTLYRIVKDVPPSYDALYRETPGWLYGSRKPRNGWFRPGQKAPLSEIQLIGHVRLEPVCQIFPGPDSKAKNVPYNRVDRIKKVDVLALGRGFAEFQTFLNQEVARFKGE